MHRVGGLIIISAALSIPGPARGQGDFFRLSPGPLSAPHAPWDKNDGCTKCHDLGGGVTDLLCLTCHHHEDLKKAIAGKHGLHASFSKPCITCHHEHRGRQGQTVEWGPLGGRRGFDHKRTGFRLTDMHARVPCTSCHKRKLRSGRTSYTGLSQGCDDCHKNPHRFTNAALRERCNQCHVPGKARKMKASELPFRHGQVTGIALDGRHRVIDCVACHKRAQMAIRGKPRTCEDCHRSPHGVKHRGKTCTDCHAPSRAWKESVFRHDPKRFPTRGKHETSKCIKCHKDSKKKPPNKCADCHQDPHRKRFEDRKCEQCHGIGGTTELIELEHDKQTKFPLRGAHASAKCRDCHRGKGPRNFEKHTTACLDCHRHANAHRGQFKGTECTKCHAEGGSKKLVFNHNRDARFKLTGFHLELQRQKKCARCHPKRQYRTGKIECYQCHKDSHKGQLGKKCDRCHLTTVRYKKTTIDHNKVTRFPLVGMHTKAKCKQCHPDRQYKRDKLDEQGKPRCVLCHAKNDKHQKKLGDDCGRCHIPDKGAPKFDHAAMTKFARDGVHAKVDCTFCHRNVQPGSPPPKVGWTKGLRPAEKKDLRFPVMGRACADCHFDPHSGRHGPACASCHLTTTFKNVSRAVHDSGAFRLTGMHDTVPCWRCHTENAPLAGLGPQCQLCHWEDDVHRNALGPLCGDCHGQQEWAPAHFNHTETGFALRGVHRMADCFGCHGLGTYQGTPTACEVCHAVDAARVRDPIHAGQMLLDCDTCHTEVGFIPARRYHPTFPLRGAHAAADCSDCHPGGVYAGTPRDCFGCHDDDYANPGNVPDHMAAGFSTRCEDCHTEISWNAARYQHQTFIRRGAHRTVPCDRCHPGSDFTSAFGGLVAGWDCGLCHDAGAPADPGGGWAQDHAQSGYPSTCELCHTEVAWRPARTPP